MRVTNKIQPHRVKELDSLRGIAALLVVIFHFTMDRKESVPLFNLGNTGVDLFFMISGFVIFMSLQHVKNGKQFVINRVSRLYPTYWACVTFTFMLITLSARYNSSILPVSVGQYIANMTMFQHVLKIGDLDGPYWTMLIEMMFYMGMLFMYQNKWLNHLTVTGVVLICLAMMLYQFKTNFFVDKLLDGFSILRYLPLFLAGIVFYTLFTHQENRLTGYLLILFCWASQQYFFVHLDRNWLMNQTDYFFTLTLYFIIFTLFIEGQLGFIIAKPTLFIGKISFALYLIHQFVSTKLIIPFLVDTLHINFWVAAFLITLPIVILLATAVTYLIEIPMGKWMKEKLQSRGGVFG